MMLPALVLSIALQGANSAPGAQADLQPAPSEYVQSTLSWVGQPAAVEVGSIVRWRVRIDDPDHGDPTLTTPEFGPEWAVLGGPTDSLDATLPKDERPDLVRDWSLLPLAGGTLSTPKLQVTFDDGSCATVPSTALEVLPSLGETEELPRPLLGFREVADRRVGHPSAALAALAGLLTFIVAGLLLWRRVQAKRRAGPAPVPAVRPIELISRWEHDGPPPAEIMGALGPLFRRAYDEGREPLERQRRAALTDEAWAAETDHGEARRLLAELSAYRYGGGQPTSFAAKDAVTRALEISRGAQVAPGVDPKAAPNAPQGRPAGDGGAAA